MRKNIFVRIVAISLIFLTLSILSGCGQTAKETGSSDGDDDGGGETVTISGMATYIGNLSNSKTFTIFITDNLNSANPNILSSVSYTGNTGTTQNYSLSIAKGTVCYIIGLIDRDANGEWSGVSAALAEPIGFLTTPNSGPVAITANSAVTSANFEIWDTISGTLIPGNATVGKNVYSSVCTEPTGQGGIGFGAPTTVATGNEFIIFVTNPATASPNYYAYAWSDEDSSGDSGPSTNDWAGGVTINAPGNAINVPTSNLIFTLDILITP